MCVKALSSVKAARLNSTSSSFVFHPMTDWSPVADVQALSFNMMLSSLYGEFVVQVGYQLAVVRPENASAPVAVGGTFHTEGYHCVQPTLFSVSNAFFWRFGVFYRNASSGNAGGDVGLDVAYSPVGAALGHETLEVFWDDDGSLAMVKPVTGWFRATGTANAKAAIVVASSFNATMTTQLCRRTANDRVAPSSWSALETAVQVPNAGNSERNTGVVSMNVGTNHWVQLGLAVARATGTVPVRASIHVATSSVV